MKGKEEESHNVRRNLICLNLLRNPWQWWRLIRNSYVYAKLSVEFHIRLFQLTLCGKIQFAFFNFTPFDLGSDFNFVLIRIGLVFDSMLTSLNWDLIYMPCCRAASWSVEKFRKQLSEAFVILILMLMLLLFNLKKYRWAFRAEKEGERITKTQWISNIDQFWASANYSRIIPSHFHRTVSATCSLNCETEIFKIQIALTVALSRCQKT